MRVTDADHAIFDADAAPADRLADSAAQAPYRLCSSAVMTAPVSSAHRTIISSSSGDANISTTRSETPCAFRISAAASALPLQGRRRLRWRPCRHARSGPAVFKLGAGPVNVRKRVAGHAQIHRRSILNRVLTSQPHIVSSLATYTLKFGSARITAISSSEWWLGRQTRQRCRRMRRPAIGRREYDPNARRRQAVAGDEHRERVCKGNLPEAAIPPPSRS